jgi:hypothetical protein
VFSESKCDQIRNGSEVFYHKGLKTLTKIYIIFITGGYFFIFFSKILFFGKNMKNDPKTRKRPLISGYFLL